MNNLAKALAEASFAKIDLDMFAAGMRVSDARIMHPLDPNRSAEIAAAKAAEDALFPAWKTAIETRNALVGA